MPLGRGGLGDSPDEKYCKVCTSFKLDMPTREEQVRRNATILGNGFRKTIHVDGSMEEIPRPRGYFKTIRKVVDDKSFARPVEEIVEQARRGCRVCNVLHELVQILLLEHPMEEHLGPFKLQRVFPQLDERVEVSRVDGTLREVPEEDPGHAIFRVKGKIKREHESSTTSERLLGKVEAALPFYPHKEDAELSVAQGSESLFKAVLSRGRLPPTLDDPTCFAKLSSWITACEQNHAQCSRNLTSQLPTRLIDVGSSSVADSCRLCVSKLEVEQYSQYVALSHCWGKAYLPQTRKDSFDEYRKCIPDRVLSKSFSDAVEITRQIGIRFLWIDSLCIIQGTDDWAIEAAKMAQVYSQAYITISLDSAKDSSEGCLNPRSARLEAPLTTAKDLDSELFVRFNRSHILPRFLSIKHVRKESESGTSTRHLDRVEVMKHIPSFTRKRCFQERILSRRIVHYTQDELVWECSAEVRCECGMDFPAPERRDARNMSQTYTKATLAALSDPEDPVRDVFKVYRHLVEEFTLRELTFPTDILPSFSAIARTFADPFGDYYAGLSAHGKLEFPCQLLWAVDDKGTPGTAHHRPQQYCAPTWSWASIQGPVTFRYVFPSPSDAVLVNISCQRMDEYAFGRVTYGEVEINAKYLETKVGRVKKGEGCEYLHFEPFEGLVECNIDTEDELTNLEGKTIWIICIDRHNLSTGAVHMTGSAKYLILRSDEIGIYRRVGLYTSSGLDAEVHWLPGLRHPWKDKSGRRLRADETCGDELVDKIDTCPRKNFVIR